MTSPAAPTQALLLLLALTLMWGTNWPLFPMALAEISIWTFRTITVGLATLLLFGFALWRGVSLVVPRRNWAWLVLASLCNLVIWNLTSALATTYMHSGQAAVLSYTMPLWVALISILFFGERLTLRLAAALACGLATVLLLMWPNLGHASRAPIGALLGLTAGLAWAVGTLVLKRIDWGAPGLAITVWQIALSWLPMMLGTLVFADWNFFWPGTRSIVVVLYIGLIPMAIGTAIWFAIVGLLPTNVAALSSIAVPIVAMISGALINSEPLGILQIAALLCAVSAIWLVLRPQAPVRASRTG